MKAKPFIEDVEKLFNAGIATFNVAENQIAFIQEQKQREEIHICSPSPNKIIY